MIAVKLLTVRTCLCKGNKIAGKIIFLGVSIESQSSLWQFTTLISLLTALYNKDISLSKLDAQIYCEIRKK